jgi:DNA-binding SARP family transcriptional activator
MAIPNVIPGGPVSVERIIGSGHCGCEIDRALAFGAVCVRSEQGVNCDGWNCPCGPARGWICRGGSAELEFSLLGPVLVRCGEEVLGVPAGKQRALLAALLLSNGRVVPAGELIDVLWGSGPPPSAWASLHNYVKRLRKILGDSGHRVIGTQPPGYLISVRPETLDVHRFGDLTEMARADARAGDWAASAQRLREALAPWRGQPLADVDSEVLAAREAPRLTEPRLQAVEARIDADLQLGRAAEMIPELRNLAGAHPLREHIHPVR